MVRLTVAILCAGLLIPETVLAGVVAAQIIEQTASAADHHQQSTATGVVLSMAPQMFRQTADAMRKNRNLHMRRTGILFGTAKLLDQLSFAFLSD